MSNAVLEAQVQGPAVHSFDFTEGGSNKGVDYLVDGKQALNLTSSISDNGSTSGPFALLTMLTAALFRRQCKPH